MTNTAGIQRMATPAFKGAVEVCNNCERAHSSKWYRGSDGVLVCRICVTVHEERFGATCFLIRKQSA